MKKPDLLDFMAKTCFYSQSHVQDLYGRENRLKCTSFIISCFLSENTKEGGSGVESNVILKELVNSPIDSDNQIRRTEDEWRAILQLRVIEQGGWK
jgi:hypothetical protein|tara:strand:+ start:739 stop:1026 length:288 start_codon:yes stop_codon:yes gene_type:complete